jgi:hypothetical protein
VRSENTAATSPAASRNISDSRPRRSGSFYRFETKIRLFKYLLAGITILFFLGGLFSWAQIKSKETEYDQLMFLFRKQKRDMHDVNSQLQTLRNKLDTLVNGRIPGLLPLKYDEIITVDKMYIRNIIFTLIKDGKKRNYEYRIVMQNESVSSIRPVVKILLFNDVGIQIGMTQVEYMDASTATEHSLLGPGEVRSYTSSINLVRDEEPRYFLLVVSDANQGPAKQLLDQLDQLGDVIPPQGVAIQRDVVKARLGTAVNRIGHP